MRRLLFVTENITLAQVVRLLALARRLPRDEYEVHFACGDCAPWLFEGTSFRRWPLVTLDGARGLAALAKGDRIYDSATFERYVADERRVLDAVKPDLVIGDFRLSLAVSTKLHGVHCASLINAYWSPYAVRDGFPVPDHPIVRLVGVERARRYFPQAMPRVFAHFAAPLNGLRQRHGLPPQSLLEQLCFGDTVLYPDLPELCPVQGAPPNHRYLGAVPWSPDLPLPPDLLAGDPAFPLVYVTLGSSGDVAALGAVMAGLEGLPLRGVVATAARATPVRLPANFRVVDFVAGDELTRHARFVVTNGGSSTGYQALAVGVPVLGVPSNLDQYLAMDAITRAGAGVTLRSGSLTAKEVRRAAVQLLDDVEMQRGAAAWGRRFAAFDCHERFQGWLEEFFRERSNQRARSNQEGA
jgi:UDP:flavonoid glycosyltransferase YjiC (YdhE family)